MTRARVTAEKFVTNDARLKRVREIKVTLPRKAS